MKRTLTMRVAPRRKNQIPVLPILIPKTSLKRKNSLSLFSSKSVGDFIARHGLGDFRCREKVFSYRTPAIYGPFYILTGKRKWGNGLLALFVAYVPCMHNAKVYLQRNSRQACMRKRKKHKLAHLAFRVLMHAFGQI